MDDSINNTNMTYDEWFANLLQRNDEIKPHQHDPKQRYYSYFDIQTYTWKGIPKSSQYLSKPYGDTQDIQYVQVDPNKVSGKINTENRIHKLILRSIQPPTINLISDDPSDFPIISVINLYSSIDTFVTGLLIDRLYRIKMKKINFNIIKTPPISDNIFGTYYFYSKDDNSIIEDEYFWSWTDYKEKIKLDDIEIKHLLTLYNRNEQIRTLSESTNKDSELWKTSFVKELLNLHCDPNYTYKVDELLKLIYYLRTPNPYISINDIHDLRSLYALHGKLTINDMTEFYVKLFQHNMLRKTETTPIDYMPFDSCENSDNILLLSSSNHPSAIPHDFTNFNNIIGKEDYLNVKKIDFLKNINLVKTFTINDTEFELVGQIFNFNGVWSTLFYIPNTSNVIYNNRNTFDHLMLYEPSSKFNRPRYISYEEYVYSLSTCKNTNNVYLFVRRNTPPDDYSGKGTFNVTSWFDLSKINYLPKPTTEKILLYGGYSDIVKLIIAFIIVIVIILIILRYYRLNRLYRRYGDFKFKNRNLTN